MANWISVHERLPDNDDQVMIWPIADFGVDCHVGFYNPYPAGRNFGKWAVWTSDSWGVNASVTPVTHWQPLLEPPIDG